ncbi:MAG TPA: hypothetical protein VM513_09635 [Kofleriaceae bacterium]|nr:hypothetical protein [Kofleriaceae bacterium]
MSQVVVGTPPPLPPLPPLPLLLELELGPGPPQSSPPSPPPPPTPPVEPVAQAKTLSARNEQAMTKIERADIMTPPAARWGAAPGYRRAIVA